MATDRYRVAYEKNGERGSIVVPAQSISHARSVAEWRVGGGDFSPVTIIDARKVRARGQVTTEPVAEAGA